MLKNNPFYPRKKNHNKHSVIQMEFNDSLGNESETLLIDNVPMLDGYIRASRFYEDIMGGSSFGGDYLIPIKDVRDVINAFYIGAEKLFVFNEHYLADDDQYLVFECNGKHINFYVVNELGSDILAEPFLKFVVTVDDLQKIIPLDFSAGIELGKKYSKDELLNCFAAQVEEFDDVVTAIELMGYELKEADSMFMVSERS